METGGGAEKRSSKTADTWQTVWRGINLLMAVFFALAALVNINDNDWYLWVGQQLPTYILLVKRVNPIYTLPLLFNLPVIVKPSSAGHWAWRTGTVVFLTLCLAYALYQCAAMVEAVEGRLENPLQHEEGREMGGLLIIICWIGISRFTSFGRPEGVPSNRGMMSALLVMTVTLAVLPLLTWAACFVGDWHTKLGHCKGMFIQ